jgi:hypothetical protein
LTEWTFIDPDAQKIHEGLMILVDVIGQLQADVTAIGQELTRKLPPSPVPGLLGEIITRLDRIEGKLPPS